MQLCNHCELLKPSPNSVNYARDRIFAKLAFGDDLLTVGGLDPEVRFKNLSDPTHCGKMSTLKFLMNKWINKERKKILLFSNFTK